jgi:predicted nicotinamide N-methyase
LKNKTVLELGSGTSLPGLLCAKFGASKVYLTDDAWQPNTLKNINEAVKINGLAEQFDRVQVKGLSWGDYTEELFDINQDKLDFVIGSDLFFDPTVFEPLLITISFLLEANPQAEVLIAVQERSNDWTIEEFLVKWKLKCSYIYPREFLRQTGIDESDLTGKHSIFILKIFPE